MGAVILITLGVVFMFDRFHFGRSGNLLPAVLLLVIGCMLLVQRTGSTEGHIDPQWQTGQIPPPQQYQNPQQWTSGPGPASPTPPPPPDSNSNDPQVKP
jgi:hypothetical protein